MLERGIAVIAGGVLTAALLADPGPGPLQLRSGASTPDERAQHSKPPCERHGVDIKAAALDSPCAIQPSLRCSRASLRARASRRTSGCFRPRSPTLVDEARAMIVDAHHHFLGPDASGVSVDGRQRLAAIRRHLADTCGRSSLKRSTRRSSSKRSSSVDETREFLETARQTDFIAGVVGWVRP